MTDIRVRRDDGDLGVITPVGRLTMVSAKSLTEAVASLVDQGAPRVVVDLGETTFIDSSGLGALVAGLKRCRQAGGDLRIARPSSQVTTVLAMTNLDKVLTPRPTVDEAF